MAVITDSITIAGYGRVRPSIAAETIIDIDWTFFFTIASPGARLVLYLTYQSMPCSRIGFMDDYGIFYSMRICFCLYKP